MKSPLRPKLTTDGQDHLRPFRIFPSRQRIQFELRPVLGEETVTEDYDPETAFTKSLINFLPEPIPEAQFKLVKPIFDTLPVSSRANGSATAALSSEA